MSASRVHSGGIVWASMVAWLAGGAIPASWSWAEEKGPIFSRLTQTADYDAWPAWSPRGDRIAFVTFVEGQGKLAILEMGATNRMTVLDTDGEVSHPRWNPTGENVVFSWTRDGKTDIHLYALASNRIISLGMDGEDPCWSPDGTRIAFVHANELWLWTWGEATILKFPGILLCPQSPCWLPDGDSVILQHAQSLLWVGLKSGRMEELPKGECVWAGHPSVSPDGERVAFVGCVKDQYDLFVLERSTNQITRLTDDTAWTDSPSWSPDGQALVCQSDRMGRDEIWVVTLDPTKTSLAMGEESEVEVVTPEIGKMPGAVPVFQEEKSSGAPRKVPEKEAVSAQEPSGSFDSFEKGNAWSVQDWGDPAVASVSEEHATEGSKSLKISYEAIGKEKVAIRRDMVLNLSGKTRFVLDVTHDGQPCSLTLAVCTGRQYVFYESETKRLKNGLNQDVTFDVDKANFKSEASGWSNTVKMGQPETTLSLFLLFYSKENSGTFYVDNLRFQ